METRYWAWDLVGIFIHALIFSIIVIFFPNAELLRIGFGIPVLVFFPGYIMTLLLFPRKLIEIEEEKKNDKKTNKRVKRSPSFKPKKEEKENKKEDDEEIKKRTKGLETVNRIALSVALSLGIVPVIGVILNSLYNVNPDIFGLRLYTILISLYIFIMGFGFLSFIRREMVPKKERFYIRIKIGPFTDGTVKDKVITSVLVSAILLSSLVGLYLYKYHHNENEKFTELFLLGPDKKISDYPDIFYVNDPKSVYLGIRNHEFENKNYTLNIYLDDRVGENVYLEDFNKLYLSANTIFTYNIELMHDEEFVKHCTFNISQSGRYSLYFVILLNDEIYREVKLQLKAFEMEDLVIRENGDLSFYLTGISGIPSRFPSEIRSGQSYEVGFGIISRLNRTFRGNLSIRIGDPVRWRQINLTSKQIYLNSTTGYFYNFELTNYGIELPTDIWLNKGKWEIEFTISSSGDPTIIKKTVLVY